MLKIAAKILIAHLAHSALLTRQNTHKFLLSISCQSNNLLPMSINYFPHKSFKLPQKPLIHHLIKCLPEIKVNYIHKFSFIHNISYFFKALAKHDFPFTKSCWLWLVILTFSQCPDKPSLIIASYPKMDDKLGLCKWVPWILGIYKIKPMQYHLMRCDLSDPRMKSILIESGQSTASTICSFSANWWFQFSWTPFSLIIPDPNPHILYDKDHWIGGNGSNQLLMLPHISNNLSLTWPWELFVCV